MITHSMKKASKNLDTYYQLNTFKMIFKFTDYNFDNQIVKKIKSMFNFMSIFHCSTERFL